MLGKLLDWIFGPEEIGPFVSAAGFSWRLVNRRFANKLNTALAKGYTKSQFSSVSIEHGYWPINRILMYVWLDSPKL